MLILYLFHHKLITDVEIELKTVIVPNNSILVPVEYLRIL